MNRASFSRIPCRILAVALLACLGSAMPVAAQTAGAELQGRVVDESQKPLPGVTVTVVNPATGYSRVAVTGATGHFRLSALPIGSYQLTAELSGFATVTVEDLRLNVATTRTLEIEMKQAAVEEAITVVAQEPLIQTSPALGTVVSRQELENLPINDRQFANLGALAPGTSLGINPDPTKVGKLVIGLNGGSGRNVNFLVDGGDNTDDTIGGQLQNFSLESVAEFNIQTSPFKAEYGRTTGGVLTVVTKSGTNELSGSVFGFFRDDELNAKTETQKRAGIDKPPFDRQQFGFSIGGPIVRDQTHYFVSAERLDQDAPYTVVTRGIFPALDGRSFAIPTENDLITVKFTHALSAGGQFQFRYGYQEVSTQFGAAPNVTPDALADLSNDFQSFLAGYNQTLGARAFNELVVQYGEFENSILPRSEDPTNFFPGGVISGQSNLAPQGTIQKKWQLRDNFSFSKVLGGRRHDFKAGIEVVHEGTLGGIFAPGKNGWFTRALDSTTAPVTQILLFGGDFKFSTPNDQFRVYFQDDWQINDRLNVHLGIRYDYTDILELDQRSNPIWQVLSTQTQFNEPYLRDFQGGRGGEIDADDDDIAPRVGFTWDITGKGRDILRGGWGIFYDFPYSNATVLFPGAAVISDFGLAFFHNNPGGIRNPDGSFWQPGDPLPANQLPPGGVSFPPNEVASPTLSTPKATQASIGFSRQVTPWLGVNIDLLSVEYRDLPFRFRANPVDPATGRRRFPQFGNFRLWYGKGRAEYEAINIGVRGRLAGRFEFQGFYTLSDAEGNILAGADEFRLTAGEHQPDLAAQADVSVNPLDPLCGRCFGPLNVDAEHRITLSGLYRAPYGILIGGLFRYRSELPYTVHAGIDLNQDGFNLDLPPDVPHVNSARGASFSQFDLRISKEFTLPNDLSLEIIGEVFNLFNRDNPVRFIGNRQSANFGNPTAFAGDPGQGEQRLGQLGVRLRF